MLEAAAAVPNQDGTVDLDFTGTEDLRLIPEGVYPARVDECEIKPSQASNKPTLYITFKLLGPEKYLDRSVWWVVSLQPQARGILQSALIGLGFARDDVQGRVTLGPATLLDRTCGVRVSHTTYQGEQQSRITRIVPLEQVPEESLTPVEAPFAAPAPGAPDSTGRAF